MNRPSPFAATARGPVWIYVVGAVAALVLVVLVVPTFFEPELIPVSPGEGVVTIAGQVAIEPADPVAGRMATVRATISADRPASLRKFTVKVSDEAGAPHDFPELADVDLGTGPKQFELRRVFPRPGVYKYYLAYQQDGDWVALPPWQYVTVR